MISPRAKTTLRGKPKRSSCPGMHPDHATSLLRLRRIQGQISGIERMIEERRYCVDILTQFRAVTSALRAVEAAVLEKHIRSCVQEAVTSKDPRAAETKVRELVNLFHKQA